MEIATLAGFCAYLFFFGLDSLGLVGADEPRYAQIAREMLARHDWITPMLNGVPWLEKPILYYWGAMLSYGAFGVSDWAARLPSAALASAMITVVYLFMRRFRPGTQLDAALIAASCAGVVGFARGASTDMPLAATFTAGLLSWYAWLETGRRRWLAGFYVCLALATLAKGPVALLLAGAIIVVFALLRRDARVIGQTLWWPGVVLFGAVALPWYVAVQIKTPQFLYVFFFEHNLERFQTNLFHHRQPFWYYLPVLLIAVLPWTTYVVAGMVAAVRDSLRASNSHGSETRATQSLKVFLLVWIAVPVVFFTFSVSKLPGYILPCLPACALLAADYLGQKLRAEQTPPFALAVLHSAIGGLLLAVALLAPSRILRVSPSGQALTIAAVAAVIVFVAMLATLRARGLLMLRFVTLVPVVLALAFIVRVVAPVVDAKDSARPVAHELNGIDAGKSPVAVFGVRRELKYGLNFYRNQPIATYDTGEIPASDHLLVARAGSEAALRARAPGRRFSRVGEFAAQHVEYYWVSSGMHHDRH